MNIITINLILSLFLTFNHETVMPERGICAHRGVMDVYPENTVSAFSAAVSLGVQMIEMDVRMTKDGHLVILHDETVDRTTDGQGPIAGMTLEEVKKLDAGSWKSPEFKGERIPTFQEALAVIARNIWLNIHIKESSREMGSAVARVIKKENRLHQAFLTCRQETAAGAKEVAENVLICNSDRPPSKDDLKYVDLSIQINSDFVQLIKRSTNPILKNTAEKLKSHGIKINFCCTDDPTEIRQLLGLGVDFILVNHAAKALEITDSMGIKRTNQ